MHFVGLLLLWSVQKMSRQSSRRGGRRRILAHARIDERTQSLGSTSSRVVEALSRRYRAATVCSVRQYRAVPVGKSDPCIEEYPVTLRELVIFSSGCRR